MDLYIGYISFLTTYVNNGTYSSEQLGINAGKLRLKTLYLNAVPHRGKQDEKR